MSYATKYDLGDAVKRIEELVITQENLQKQVKLLQLQVVTLYDMVMAEK